MWSNSCIFFVILVLSFIGENLCQTTPVWTYECIEGYCQKRRITPGSENTAISLSACQLLCSGYGSLWPQPTGEISIGNVLVHINFNSIDILEGRGENSVASLIRAGGKNFKKQIESLATPRAINSGGKSLIVTMDIADPEKTQLTLDTDESYSLKVSETSDGRMNATISAPTYFGGRHGLETLGQVIIYDDLRDQLQMPKDVYITDKPVYPYRGILLDTARNYISVATIKRTIDAISASKLNTLHWHITDTHSFPYVSTSRPELSQIGAYSKKKVYTPSDVEEIVKYAKERGVRVLPEFDAPAHVGEGWQDTDFVACFNKQPWQDYCVEPPCGQFDPTRPKLYDALENIYKDMIAQFNPDIFHMGGDEVSMSCWNSTPSIVEWMKAAYGWDRKEEDFIKLWDVFQSQALERFDRQAGKKIPIVMWTSTLTKKEYVEQYLPKDRYIIQIWTTGRDKVVSELLDAGYRLILSNYDALYLDCGYAGWVQGGNNWCSPYIGWQKLYDNSPAEIGGNRKNQFLGAEAALWTEQVDDTSVDSRIWPRAAALAERLWAEPTTNWRAAEPRMLIHRQRLVNRGIQADALEPEWCLQYEENCPLGGKFNRP
ncbi:hypothetical protein ILUMI_06455 [Ignelater luminosus]|uniref:beta-N-acetylhexosaminidase n=1 Tax=Ignelater luminosus TaxID=2038154 RepID=A0A8K0GH75_IGNLU|nr:hypothetical protein ILUMI_06455 [Ignelater luminosus]